MVEGRESITAASAAYLNHPVERTAHSARFVAVRVAVPVGRRSPGALGPSSTRVERRYPPRLKQQRSLVKERLHCL